jgi:membrane-bound lytic murein transglycosylase D
MAADLDLKELLILNPSFKKQIINGSALEPKPLVIPTVNNTVYASLYNLFNGMPDDSIPVPLQTGLKEPEGSKTVLKEVQKVLSGKSIPSSKPAAAKKETTYIHYIVKAGDTLSEIAEKFQGLTVSKLKALNGLTKTAIIPGMRLKILKDNS